MKKNESKNKESIEKNIEKLEAGMSIKNYKELCSILDLEISESSNSKKAQLKEIERYIEMHKEGNTYVIDKVNNTIKQVQDKRIKTIYGLYVQQLILSELIEHQTKNRLNKKGSQVSMNLTKLEFFERLHMVNMNYGIGYKNKAELARLLAMDRKIINDFYLNENGKLVSLLENSLDKLRNKMILFWRKAITISYLDKEGNVKSNIASNVEIEKIISIEKKVANDMGYEDRKNIMLHEKYLDFVSKVCEELKQVYNRNIITYFRSYEVIYNNFIWTELEKVSGLLLKEEEERKFAQKKLNELIVENHKNSVKENNNKIVVGDKSPETNYVEKRSLLIDTLLDENAEDIAHKLTDKKKKKK